jgi:hypothetical protein
MCVLMAIPVIFVGVVVAFYVLVASTSFQP